MARMNVGAEPKPVEIKTYLGLNESVGETEIKMGEAVLHDNFRTTNNYKVSKRPGQKTLIDYENTESVYGGWHGVLNSKDILVTCNDGKVYEYDFDLETNTQIGTITNVRTTIFWFASKIYFINGTDYKEYDGTTYQDVSPYVPTTFINAPPTGGGTALEDINNLTGKQKETFISLSGSTAFTLSRTNLTSIDEVYVNDVLKTITTDYTENLTTGTVTFNSGLSVDDEVLVQSDKISDNNSALVKNNRFATIFGPGNATTIFMWGNTNFPNRRIRSYAEDPSYFPQNNFTNVGTDEFAITDIVPQYDRLLIFKVDKTHYSLAEYITLTEEYAYPIYDLNNSVGNVAFDSVQLIENYPVSLKGQSCWQWSNTQVQDERNAKIISDRVKLSLDDADLTTAITFDYQKQKEYWLNIDDEVIIWNYGNDTWYKYLNIEATWFVDIRNIPYFGTTGKVIEINPDYLNDDGISIPCNLELGFTDLGINHLNKVSRKMWTTIEPGARTSVTTSFETNKKNTSKEFVNGYKRMSYAQWDYSDFSYLTSVNPQPFRDKIRANKYAYIKIKYSNNSTNETLTILSTKLLAETLGEVR